MGNGVHLVNGRNVRRPVEGAIGFEGANVMIQHHKMAVLNALAAILSMKFATSSHALKLKSSVNGHNGFNMSMEQVMQVTLRNDLDFRVKDL
jgi:hypothetical protein